MHDMINRLKDVDAVTIPKAKKCLEDPEVQWQLKWAATYLRFLPKKIKEMEEEDAYFLMVMYMKANGKMI